MKREKGSLGRMYQLEFQKITGYSYFRYYPMNHNARIILHYRNRKFLKVWEIDRLAEKGFLIKFEPSCDKSGIK